MLSFAVYAKGQLADKLNLNGAYTIGSDDVPLRAEISFKDGHVRCKKRTAGPAGIALPWAVPQTGTILLETVRLPERERPYVLSVELARGRLARLAQKIEDWGMFQYNGAQEVVAAVDRARDRLIAALKSETVAEAAERGDAALTEAVNASEALTRFHAEVFLQRRIQGGNFPRRPFGCTVPPDSSNDALVKRLAAAFDFVTVPFIWRELEPNEQTFNWKPVETWLESLSKNRVPMRGSALLSFAEWNVPDWLYIWEHDFDTIRDFAFEHARRLINRYGQYIQVWDVISGINAINCFAFTIEQLMEFTRMTTSLCKQTCPRGTTVIDITAPWGEYYARNQLTIPPLLYADMVSQSNINFDAFGVQFFFGPAIDGMFVRDMFQISSQLDLFGKLGKPVHVTAASVPSARPPRPTDSDEAATEGGKWHDAWSEQVQAQWLRDFVTIALSKPFVESVSWHHVLDHPKQTVTHGGLLRADGTPKQAFQELVKIRNEIRAGGKGPRA